jgi:hypothetical protein
MPKTQALAALNALNAGDLDGARRILAATVGNEETPDNDDEIEECDAWEDFPPDDRFAGIPRNWMGEPC